MPSTSLFGCRLRQLATDFTPFYLLPAIVQVVWLFIYWIGVAAFSHPEHCEPGTESSIQQYYATYICLGFFFAQAVVTCAAALLTLRGTPLEPSKRRWVVWLSGAFVLSIPINFGLLAWGAWVVEAGDGSCWSSDDKKMPATIFFGGLGVPVGQLVGFVLSYNMLGGVTAGDKFATSTRTGVSGLVHLVASWGAQHRGPMAQLEGILTELQQQLVAIDGEKSDAGAALACAALVQQEALEAAVAAAAAGGGAAAGAAQGSAEVAAEDGAAGLAANGAALEAEAAPAAAKPHGPSAVLEWAAGVCRGAAAGTAGAAGEQQAPVGEEAAAEALHWSRFAVAPYGSRLHSWRRGKTSSCAARGQLSKLAAAAAAEHAQPLAGWGTGAAVAAAATRPHKPSRAERRSFAVARDLLGPGCQIVSFSNSKEKRGLLPHLVAVDRERQAVVLGIAGTWQWPHVVPEVAPTPAGWVGSASAAAAEHGTAGTADDAGKAGSAGVDGVQSPNGQLSSGPGGSWAHRQSLQAAQALLQDLDSSQLLQRLLRPAGGNSGGGGSGDPLASLDCTGWRLVVAGHGVGGGAAALLAPKLADQHLAPAEVWAFGPPGELCSADVAAAIAASCRMTAVALGVDAAPRTTAVSLAALMDQAVVGLARLRYPKMALLAVLAADRIGPRRFRRRWTAPSRALRPLSDVPPEALAYLQVYHAWRQEQVQQQQPPCALPGRVLMLSRSVEQLVPQAGAGGDAEVAEAAGGADGSSSSSSSEQEEWRASWASGEELAASGIQLTSRTLSDHYASRLLAVLTELAQPGEDSSDGDEAAAEGEASVSPSKQPLRLSSGHSHRHSD